MSPINRKITVALAGNPNSGKTTIFNRMTGARQHVGNYPGVTVEKKEGFCRHNGVDMLVVDLPGTYSLTAYSMEEIVARNFVVDEKPDVVIDIVDCSNLERNLYLATQFIELGVPLVLAFNMSDVAKSRGYEIDIDMLSDLLDVRIVKTVGHKGHGVKELLDAAMEVAETHHAPPPSEIKYGGEIEEEIQKIEALIKQGGRLTEKYRSRWLALKLLENDSQVREKIQQNTDNHEEIIAQAEKSTKHIEKVCGDHPEILIADRRYGFISGACQETLVSTVEARHTMSDKIDSVLINRTLGLPIFAILMFLLFHLVFTFGAPPMDWMDSGCAWLGETISGLWPEGSESVLKSLLVDGIIGGVGAVVIFLPNILLLFFAIAFLEDTGYMARAAFIMDRLMHKIGLHGKSFIPMLIGFGCSVPAIMATRTLESRRDRLTTMLVTPLMSCSARLPIYILIIGAFFSRAWSAPMLFLMYFIGIVVAVLGAKVLRSTLFKGEATPFVMELPPYRMPTLRGTFIHMWERSRLYIKKAGTIILVVSIILWALTSFPDKKEFDKDYDALADDAKSQYLAGAKELNASIGLPKDSDLIVRTLEGESPGKLAEAHPEMAPAVGKLVKVRDEIIAEREAFEADVEERGLEEGLKEYEEIESQLEENLAGLQADNPEIYPAAIRLIDEVQDSYDERLESLEFEKEGEKLAYSIAGRIGHGIEPIVGLMGFDWRMGTALFGAFAAKEVFVAQMGIVYSLGEADEESEGLRGQLRKNYTPLVGFCIMLFSLLSLPCVATLAVTKREANSWGWAIFQMVSLTIIAFVLTVIVFQAGCLLGIGVS